MQARSRLLQARQLMDDFAVRTGLGSATGDSTRRYLWTDAFAVQCFFELARAAEEGSYYDLALKLIDRVHEVLGSFHPDDEREGWISGLREAEAANHPTIGGLRIGKHMPERGEGDLLDERLEWERDGQYFHYLTRWFTALLQAGQETSEHKYARWAAELIWSTRKFIYRRAGRPGMYWKMSTDLSRPLVPSMGAHDPLEGLICTAAARHAVPAMEQELSPLLRDFKAMCAGQDWATPDPLGIGGLLHSTLRAGLLEREGLALPTPAAPEKLWADTLNSLQFFARQHSGDVPARARLAFRECGLALGLRALHGAQPLLQGSELNLQPLDQYLFLASEIEDFWLEPYNQQAATWTGHLDINAVTLAASLVASLPRNGEHPAEELS